VEIVWRGIEVESLERLSLREAGDGVTASSVIDSARGRYSYEVALDRDWTFRSLHLEALAGHRALDLVRGPEGWTLDGAPRPDLAGCVDIDLAVSPFTNSLPIRRLGLDDDDEADLEMAYVSFPDLEVFADPQRYTRLDEETYLYESLDSDFTAELTVDARGIVTDYPGLFERY
jgi:uncharacterized protein